LKKNILSITLLSLFTLLSAETLHIKIPTVPEVPKVTVKVPEAIVLDVEKNSAYKTNEEILEEATREKVIHFSNHVAPKSQIIKDDPKKVVLVGEVKDGRVCAYLHAPLLPLSDIEKILQKAGFDVLQTFKIDKKGTVSSLIFTNADILKLAAHKDRGFISTLRITIDTKDKLISITNPVYIMSAFLQDAYDEKIALKTLASLRSAFGNLSNSDEKFKFTMLPHYQFMQGMPKYQDMQTISKLSSEKLLANARKSKKIVYEQKLSNGATLIGVKLSKRTSKFIKKIGYQNAGLLPYPVLIEEGEAKILDPKYYIAVMYPTLKMSQFMTIATVPGAINKDIDRIFR